jgi:hypothetical protein
MIDVEREPTLDDVLSDPVVHALMACDRVDAEALRALLERVQQRAHARQPRPPGEVKAAAAHEWMTSLHERGRALGRRLSARDVVIDA